MQKDADNIRFMRNAYFGQSVGVVLYMLFTRSAFGTLFIKQLGGSDAVAMWVLAVAGMAPLLQIPISLIVHPARGKRFLLTGWLGFGVLMGMAALVPTFVRDADHALGWVVFFLVAALLMNLAAATFWFPLLHGIIPEDFRGRFFGKLRATWSSLLFCATVGGGVYLGEFPATWHFQAVIAAGVGLVFVRHLLLMRLPGHSRTENKVEDFRDWKRYLRDFFKNPPVRRFCIYVAIMGFCAGFLGHPLVLYMREMGFSPRDNIIVFGFTTLGMVATLVVGGYVVDRLGVRVTLRLVHVATLVSLLAIAGITALPLPYVRPLLAAAFAFSGAAIAIFNLASTTQFFHYVPERGRVFFLSFTNALLFLGPALAMLIAGAVLKVMGSTRTVQIGGAEANVFQLMLLVAAGMVLFIWPLLRRERKPFERE